MTINQTYQDFITALQSIYDGREANSIGRIVFEDAFSIYALNSQKPFPDSNQSRLKKILNRLLKHEPVQYILGEADFYGYKFKVDSNVLIPRQETEELVYWIKNTISKEYANHPRETVRVLDIGTGSGCIPITLKNLLPELEVSAMDVSESALKIAKENASALLENPISFIRRDILNVHLWENSPHYDLIISNPPYIPEKEKKLMPERVLKHEPDLALFVSDDDPLLFYKKIALFAKDKLLENGQLFFEVNEYNANEVVDFLKDNNYTDVILEQDINGKDRMIKAKVAGATNVR